MTLRQQIWNVLRTILRMAVLKPIQYIANTLFPLRDTDGISSSAVTAKAARQFVQYLQSQELRGKKGRTKKKTQQQQPLLNTTNDDSVDDNNDNLESDCTIDSVWSTNGFHSVKSQAIQEKSLIVLYLHSELHGNDLQCCKQLLLPGSSGGGGSSTPTNAMSNAEPNSNNFGQLTKFIHLCNSNASAISPRILATGYSIHTGQGSHLMSMLDVTELPSVLVLQPAGSSTLHVKARVEGMPGVTHPNLLVALAGLQHQYKKSVQEHRTRELVREQEQLLRAQQDEEYHATMAADQQRQDAKQRQEAEEAEKVAQEQAAEEQKTMDTETKLQASRDLILPEPDSDVTTIRFCLPNGKKVVQKFHSTEQTVRSLRAYIYVYCHDNDIRSEGNDATTITNIGLSTTYPKRTYNNIEGDDDDNTLTLKEADLAPQAVLMVQDLDA